MINKNTEAQVKAQIIQRINDIKPQAIDLGFDYPTESPENVSVNELISFLVEISVFVGYAVGYNDATHDPDGIWSEDPIVTH